MENVSPLYVSSRGLATVETPSEVLALYIDAWMQVTPYLRSGEVVGHPSPSSGPTDNSSRTGINSTTRSAVRGRVAGSNPPARTLRTRADTGLQVDRHRRTGTSAVAPVMDKREPGGRDSDTGPGDWSHDDGHDGVDHVHGRREEVEEEEDEVLVIMAWNLSAAGGVDARTRNLLKQACEPCVGSAGATTLSRSYGLDASPGLVPRVTPVDAGTLASIFQTMENSEDDMTPSSCGATNTYGVGDAAVTGSDRKVDDTVAADQLGTARGKKRIGFHSPRLSSSVTTGTKTGSVTAEEASGSADEVEVNPSQHSLAKSSKVVPTGAEATENRSQSSAGQSKVSVSTLHRTLEAGLSREDSILTLLSLLMIGLSVTSTVISERVIAEGVSSATLAGKKGDRAMYHQVCGGIFLRVTVILVECSG